MKSTMETLGQYINKWINGERVKGVNVTLCDIHELIDIYNDVEHETINNNVVNVLNKCGIKTIPYGIGWRF